MNFLKFVVVVGLVVLVIFFLPPTKPDTKQEQTSNKHQGADVSPQGTKTSSAEDSIMPIVTAGSDGAMVYKGTRDGKSFSIELNPETRREYREQGPNPNKVDRGSFVPPEGCLLRWMITGCTVCEKSPTEIVIVGNNGQQTVRTLEEANGLCPKPIIR